MIGALERAFTGIMADEDEGEARQGPRNVGFGLVMIIGRNQRRGGHPTLKIRNESILGTLGRLGARNKLARKPQRNTIQVLCR